MPEASLFLTFIECLEDSGLAYMVTGSVASMIYAEPRFTNDIDMVLELTAEDIPAFIKLFVADKFYCPPQEVIETEIGRQKDGHFNIIHHESGFKADIYPVCKDELHVWAMSDRRQIEYEQMRFWVAPPEYVIIRKLQYFKEGGSIKHLHDVKRMVDISGNEIDETGLIEKINDYGLAEQWEQSRILK